MQPAKKQKSYTDHFDLAYSSWIPTRHEKNFLQCHSYVKDLNYVDEIWPWLSKNYGEIQAVKAPHARHPENFNYREISHLISLAAHSFFKLGIRQGDVVSVFSENSPRWLVADQGIMRVGASNAVRGANAPVEELRFILEDSKSVALVVQNSELWEKLDLSESDKNNLSCIIQLEGKASPGVIGWDDFLLKEIKTNNLNLVQERLKSESSSQIATILYTSGTTGKPKGVPLTHGNLLHQISSLACVAYPDPGDPVLSVLPIWHSYERSAEYYFFSCACTQSYTTIKNFRNDIPKVRPVVMATVPRLWESIKVGFDEAIKAMPPGRRRILIMALENSRQYKFALRAIRGLMLERINTRARLFACLTLVKCWPIHMISSLTLWPKILRKLSGGRLKYPISGGGAIAPHIDSFFESLGIELLVGYGLTETSPVISCRRPWRNVRRSSGQPLPETEFKIVDPQTQQTKFFNQKGLVMVRGPQVMNGYFENEVATNKVLDNNGWFNTGDLGILNNDGILTLTGRYKDTIVLSNGENIEPGPLEEVLCSLPFIEQIMLVGQDQKQMGALIVPKIEKILEWEKVKHLGLTDDLGGIPGDLALRKILRQEVNYLLSVRAGARPIERVLGVSLVKPFTIENGLLTQTLKQRRDKIIQINLDAIASIYNDSML